MMVSDLLFKLREPLSDGEHDLLVSLDCWYQERNETYRFPISETNNTVEHLDKIAEFLRVQFPGQFERLLREKLVDKCVMITTTVPHPEGFTRRIHLTPELMSLLVNYNIKFDYEVAPCSDDEGEEDDGEVEW